MKLFGCWAFVIKKERENMETRTNGKKKEAILQNSWEEVIDYSNNVMILVLL